MPASPRDAIDACTGYPGIGYDPIAYIDAPTENLGELKTSGIDLSAAWRSGATPSGNFGVVIDGTYVTKYEFQRERGGTFINAARPLFGQCAGVPLAACADGDTGAGPVWRAAPAIGSRAPTPTRTGTSKVGSLFDVRHCRARCTGVKNLTLTAGVMNLFDKDPPLYGQNTTFQRGFDPRFTSPLAARLPSTPRTSFLIVFDSARSICQSGLIVRADCQICPLRFTG